MSNTSAANLIIPIVTALAAINPSVGAMGVAFACSLAMCLPISTPPNAIAFATQEIETREMVKYGAIVSAIGVVLVVGLMFLLMQWSTF